MESIVGDQSMKFDQVQDVPGYGQLVKEGRTDVVDFIQNNINDVNLCLQASRYQTSDPLVYINGELTSAAGWHVSQVLGKGKDGITFLGCRYSDVGKENKTVKFLSKYAKLYVNHTILFSNICKSISNKNNNFFKIQVTNSCTYYNNSQPLKEVEADNFDSILPELCRMNSWSIVNTGFAFWDFGFGSGRNYMTDNDGNLRWIDYGGAGMVRCPSFNSIYEKHKLPKIQLSEPYPGKQSLIIADSDFLMCQFLLHIEYWKSRAETNADIWSSMLQIRHGIASEFVEMLPATLSSDLTQGVYNKFKKHDWTDNITWKQLGKYINANT